MEEFTNHIQAYLEAQAEVDPIFGEKYHATDLKLDDCITYILNWVKATGTSVVAKEEIYSQAIHFFSGDVTPEEIGKPIQCQVVCATRAELTEADKEEARKVAIKQYQEAEMAKLRQQNQPKPKPTAPKQTETAQAPSLFDF